MRAFIDRFDGVGGPALLAFAIVSLAGAGGAWSQVLTRGAEITTSRIVVDGASHWSHWSMPTHAVDLVGDRVEFHYFRDRFNVVEDHATYERDIPALKFRKGVGAVHSVATVGRRFTYDDKGEIRLRSDLKMDKYLDTHYLKYPGSETHLVLDDELWVITDTSMTSTKEGQLTLQNVATGGTSRRDFETKTKNPVPIYQYFARMGISRVGSNPPEPGVLFDGDGSTYWEPSAGDALDDWWIEVDLGRSVLADQIVLKFVDEELGHPFRQFRVSIFPWQEPLVEEGAEANTFGRRVLDGIYKGWPSDVLTGLAVVGGTQSPNEHQRLFTIDLEPPDDAEPTWTGRGVQVIRIQVFDTKGGRHTRLSPLDQELAEAEWEALEAGDQGDILYFVRSQGGFEEPVTAARYAELPVERQGRREYYRRELPRLAEVEVWGLGDDLSPGIIAGGGSAVIETETAFIPAGLMFDGDYGTVGRQMASLPGRDRDFLTVDLGAVFWLDQLRIAASFLPCQTCADAFDGYIHWFSGGTRDASGHLQTERLSPFQREDITSPDIAPQRHYYPGLGHPYKVVDDYPWAPKVRYLQGRILSNNRLRTSGGANIREYHLYTRAYPAEAVLESDLFALPPGRNFGRIFWDAKTPPGTQLEVRTRSGDRINTIVNYYNKAGEFVSNDVVKWEKLGPNKGGTDTTFVPTAEAWSLWSNPYASSGAWVTSPGGRRFMQVQVKMVTEDREVAPSLRSLEIELTPPIGERMVAEVHPERVAAAGVLDTFEVFIRPRFIEDASSGFDELLLQLGSGGMALLDLGLGIDGETGVATQLFRAQGEQFVDENGEALDVLRGDGPPRLQEELDGDSLWVRFPEALNLPPGAPREYRRLTAEGDQVPTDAEGFPLTAAAWGLLEEAEQGDVRYFRILQETGESVPVDADGDTLTAATHEALEPSEQGPIRYFRILQGAGESVPFDTDGDSLTAAVYGELDSDEQGLVVGAGELMRLRYAAPVYRHGTTLAVAVRHSDGGLNTDKPWQTVEAGDATPLVASNTLSIALPLGGAVLDQVELHPNPFTPNGDGVNDAVRIGFSVFQISADRELTVGVYTLDGRRVWEQAQMLASGAESVEWTGVDAAGSLVPPGLYVCKVALDVDSEERGGTSIAKLVAVVY